MVVRGSFLGYRNDDESPNCFTRTINYNQNVPVYSVSRGSRRKKFTKISFSVSKTNGLIFNVIIGLNCYCVGFGTEKVRWRRKTVVYSFFFFFLPENVVFISELP